MKGENIYVLSAGGLSIGYLIGAACSLQKNLGIPKVVIGTSAGAIVGLILSLRINIKEFIPIFYSRIGNNFLFNENIYQIFSNLYSKHYLFENDLRYKFLDIVYDIGNISHNINFYELYQLTGIEYFINGTDMDTHENIYFSVYTTPYVRVYDAILASSSIPYLFKPMKFDFPDGQIRYVIDGASSCELCIDIFNKNSHLCILNDKNLNQYFNFEKYQNYNMYACVIYKKNIREINTSYNFIDRFFLIPNANNRKKLLKLLNNDDPDIKICPIYVDITYSYFDLLHISLFYDDCLKGEYQINKFLQKK